MRWLVTLAVLGAWSGPAWGAERPNVLFVAIDDLNDWIGCLGGHPQAHTPNIDRLAKRGILFTNAHCASPACNPSRAALFSGRMPWQTGVWSNQSGSIQKNAPDVKLLPQVLAADGYRTLGAGKMLHSRGGDAFEEYYAAEQRWSPLARKAVRYTPEEQPSKGTTNPRHVTRDSRGREVVLPLNRMPSDRNPGKPDGESFDWGPWDVPDADFGDTRITDWAIERLGEEHAKPFFLGVGYYRPHIPLWAPARFFERWKRDEIELPKVLATDLDDLGPVGRKWAVEPITAGSHATVVEHDQWRDAVHAYLACTTYVDAEVGRLLDALDAGRFGENTLIVLWTDHGWHLGEKQHWGKWTGWERSTRVPLIVVPPRSRAAEFAKAGSRCDAPVGLIDLFPTIAEFADVKVPESLAGQSLVPLLRDPDAGDDRIAVTSFDPGNVSLRTSRWRYVRYADGSEELYDHAADPREWRNLAGDDEHRETLRRLRERVTPEAIEEAE